MDVTLLPVYLAALAGVYILPGPDMALVIATGAARGARTAAVTACGIALSRATHVLLSGMGLAALMVAHPGMLSLVKWIGAVYLCYLAVQLVRADIRLPAETAATRTAGSFLLRGFLTNLLNPKALLFCSLLLPQFISDGAGPVLVQYLWLGGLLVATGLMFDILYALFAVHIARRMKTPSGAGKFVLPAVFVLLAGRLVAG